MQLAVHAISDGGTEELLEPFAGGFTDAPEASQLLEQESTPTGTDAPHDSKLEQGINEPHH